MLQIGMIVKILPDAEYSGKFTGYIGKVKNYFSQNKKVIYSGPKTIILWADNTKTIVSCGEADSYDYYSGFCAAVVKKLFGSTTHAKKVLGASLQIND